MEFPRQNPLRDDSMKQRRDHIHVNGHDVTPISRAIAEYAGQLGDGDLSALGRLFDAVGPRTVRYADTLTRNREDSEDTLQAAMIRVAQHPQCLAHADYPWAYFLRIVRNEALKIVGRRKPASTLTNATRVWTEDDAETEREESRAQVRAALKRLPPEQAEVVVLKIWEGMTFLEIAEVLNESANTAASRYRYALAKLTRYLQPLADEVC